MHSLTLKPLPVKVRAAVALELAILKDHAVLLNAQLQACKVLRVLPSRELQHCIELHNLSVDLLTL